ncbi:hypothetical protein Bbelb_319630 [Branchiostoma belcheri]|nr:hypothetical protein Bbelb_319630 [Branchiostoma belcheri]
MSRHAPCTTRNRTRVSRFIVDRSNHYTTRRHNLLLTMVGEFGSVREATLGYVCHHGGLVVPEDEQMKNVPYCDRVAQSVARSTHTQEVAGSNPAHVTDLVPLRKALYTIFLTSLREPHAVHVKEPTALIEKSSGPSRCEWFKPYSPVLHSLYILVSSPSRSGWVLFGAAGALPRPTQLGLPVGFARGAANQLPVCKTPTGITLLPGGLLSWTGGTIKCPEDSLSQPR